MRAVEWLCSSRVHGYGHVTPLKGDSILEELVFDCAATCLANVKKQSLVHDKFATRDHCNEKVYDTGAQHVVSSSEGYCVRYCSSLR